MHEERPIPSRGRTAGVALALLLLAAGCPRGAPPVVEPAPGPAPAADVAPAAPDATTAEPTEPTDIAGAPNVPDPAAPEPPEAVITQVPEIPLGPCPAEEPSQCTVELHAPAAGRMVSFRTEGVTLRFGFDDFRATAAEHNEREVLEYLDGRPADENPVRLDREPRPQTNRWPFVVAALLDAGQARVHDDGADRDVDSIVRETWDWVGCSGGCRQSGRQYRLQVPGAVFFNITDLFEDSF
jgi:hypothetical protein